MDAANLADVGPGTDGRVLRFRDFDPRADGELDVPDPYYGADDGFEHVLAIVRRTAAEIVRQLGVSPACSTVEARPSARSRSTRSGPPSRSPAPCSRSRRPARSPVNRTMLSDVAVPIADAVGPGDALRRRSR